MTETIVPSYLLLLSTLAISIFFSWMAWLRGFFRSSKYPPTETLLAGKDIIAFFLAFILIYLIVPTAMLALSRDLFPSASLSFHITISQCTIFVALLFFYYILTTRKKGTFARIWKDYSFPLSAPLYMDAAIGALTWLISLPVVGFTARLFDLIVYHTWGLEGPDQTAVLYLKQAQKSPVQLLVALICIVIFAPLIEEYLFRGCFQSWLRNKLSFFKTNIITSVLFALMHYSSYQGTSNLPLLTSLFVLSLYIGYTYERQRSLIAPITLHLTFNFISAIRIIGTNISG
ncbi:MAG: CPBP family intramembrane metalloprotease [Simkaniaceae bacterium]|nr:CPBP family intramembrane metalloprotease [Simkaniaceae bacterium]